MKIKMGDWALFGSNKSKRIYIGQYKDKYLAVAQVHESAFKAGSDFNVIAWSIIEEIIIIERRYQWRSDSAKGRTIFSDYVSDELAERIGYTRDATTWYKTDKYVKV